MSITLHIQEQQSSNHDSLKCDVQFRNACQSKGQENCERQPQHLEHTDDGVDVLR